MQSCRPHRRASHGLTVSMVAFLFLLFATSAADAQKKPAKTKDDASSEKSTQEKKVDKPEKKVDKPAASKEAPKSAKEKEKAKEKAEADEPALPVALTKEAPQTLDDLRAIESAVQKVVEKGLPATVGIRIGSMQGSGVIISEDGYVLTAGHVIIAPGRDATLIFPDGKRVKAKTLGLDRSVDSGLIKITEKGKWPYVEMARSSDVKPGDWCVALGHPRGYQTGRPPVARVGRVIQPRSNVVWTDCTLVGGDSGGPLFDMQGRVIGINDRINNAIVGNFHVPVDAYHDKWDRLVKGDSWGGPPPVGGPLLGISGENHADGCKVLDVFPDSPADKAGIKPDDIITRLAKSEVKGLESLQTLVAKRNAGEKVKLSIRRGKEEMEVEVTLARRQESR